MTRILQVFYIIFSSLALSLAIPNELFYFGSPVIAFFALIPFYIQYTKNRSYLESALFFMLLTFTTQLFSSWWLGCFKEFALVTLFFTCFGTSLEGFAAGLVLFLPFSKYAKKGRVELEKSYLNINLIPMRALYFSFVYVFYEYIKSKGFLGYPWGTVSMAMYSFRSFIQIADITGTYGITFITVLTTAVITEAALLFTSEEKILKFLVRKKFTKMKKKYPEFFSLCDIALFCSVLLISSLLYGFVKINQTRKPVKILSAIMVQQNRDPWKQENDNETIKISQRLTEEKLSEIKKEGKKADIVVWSEGCLKYSFPSANYHYKHFPASKPLTTFIKDTGVPFVFGGSYVINDSPRQAVNATLLFDEKGEFRGFYGKMHLVPFAEVVPFADIPKVASFLRNKLGVSTGWHHGNQYVYYDVRGSYPENKIQPPVNVISLKDSAEDQRKKEREQPFVRLSTPVCYDDSFPDVCTPLFNNGSELLLNLTDDSWSMKKSSEYQHFVVSSFRAIELRTTLARSTNSGYSAVIDPTGKVLYDMPLFEEKAMHAEIPIYQHKKTIFSMFGAWEVVLIQIFLFFIAIKEWLALKENVYFSDRRISLKKSKKKSSKNSKKKDKKK